MAKRYTFLGGDILRKFKKWVIVFGGIIALFSVTVVVVMAVIMASAMAQSTCSNGPNPFQAFMGPSSVDFNRWMALRTNGPSPTDLSDLSVIEEVARDALQKNAHDLTAKRTMDRILEARKRFNVPAVSSPISPQDKVEFLNRHGPSLVGQSVETGVIFFIALMIKDLISESGDYESYLAKIDQHVLDNLLFSWAGVLTHLGIEHFQKLLLHRLTRASNRLSQLLNRSIVKRHVAFLTSLAIVDSIQTGKVDWQRVAQIGFSLGVAHGLVKGLLLDVQHVDDVIHVGATMRHVRHYNISLKFGKTLWRVKNVTGIAGILATAVEWGIMYSAGDAIHRWLDTIQGWFGFPAKVAELSTDIQGRSLEFYQWVYERKMSDRMIQAIYEFVLAPAFSAYRAFELAQEFYDASYVKNLQEHSRIETSVHTQETVQFLITMEKENEALKEHFLKTLHSPLTAAYLNRAFEPDLFETMMMRAQKESWGPRRSELSRVVVTNEDLFNGRNRYQEIREVRHGAVTDSLLQQIAFLRSLPLSEGDSLKSFFDQKIEALFEALNHQIELRLNPIK